MTAPLPAELSRLDADYNNLIDNVEAGHTSIDDALSVLAAMTATDASGAVWAINGDGDFVRAPYPGAPAAVTDPSEWFTPGTPQPTMPAITFPMPHPQTPVAPAGPPVAPPPFAPGAHQPPTMSSTAPSAGPARPAGGWDDDVDDMLTQPPARDQWGAPVEQPAPAAAGFTAPAPLSVDDMNPAGEPAGRWTRRANRDGRSTARPLSTSDAPTARHTNPLLETLLEKARQNVLVLGILGVGALVLIVMTARGDHSGSNQPNTLPTGAPTSSLSAPLPTMPTGSTSSHTKTSAAVAPPSTTVTSTAPTTAQARAVISALMTGKKNDVAALAATGPDRVTLDRVTALWAGAKQLGLAVTPTPAAASGAGAVQNWAVYDGSVKVATVHITWVQVDKAWKLADLPTF